MNINFFMEKALEQAAKGLLVGEVPIGAVLVDNNKSEIIASSHNLINLKKNATYHAEILTINSACVSTKSKYLSETSLFVTLEPCAMCAAAISEVHIDKIYFGAYDEQKGSLESIMNIYFKKKYFIPEIYGGILENECSNLIKSFFKDKR